ncbi:uncharacterized protein G2W53_017511 [Senna tora]|uniref:Uncharacterized protein n=1 Tax=Senna tora TaxID=362788 RepID=A0A834TS18_9FABA|nr:uncharacterized protein G2W53_017511 [Senna tora]
MQSQSTLNKLENGVVLIFPSLGVHESPVTQNLEEFSSTQLGSGRLRVVPTSCGSFPCCEIWSRRGWVLGLCDDEVVTSLMQALEDKW